MLFLMGLALVFAAIAVVALGSSSAQLTGVARSLELIEHGVDHKEVARQDLSAKERLLAPTVASGRAIANRLSPVGTVARLSRQLDQAGNPPDWPVEKIMSVKGIALVVGALLGVLYGGGLTARGAFLGVVGAAACFFLPDLLVYNATIRRRDAIRKSFADSLDMLTLCVEAGQGFDAALLRVARSTDGPMAAEFARVLSEIQLGTSRADAFSSLAERSTATEVRTFVSSLVQADRLGVPIGQVLREQTAEMRLIRRQRAEEQAQKLPVKIIFPLMFGIMPAIFIVLLGPAAIHMMEAFSNL